MTVYSKKRPTNSFHVPSDTKLICRDYLKTPSVCDRGDACKFVHLEWTKHPSPDGAPFCIRDILGECCDRGSRCNFFHISIYKTPSVSPHQLAPDGRQYCIDHKRGTCDKGSSCRFYHTPAMQPSKTAQSKFCRDARIPKENPWSKRPTIQPDFRVSNIQSFLSINTKGMSEKDTALTDIALTDERGIDVTKDSIFRGKNTYKKPISKEEDKEIDELLKEPFSLFANDPFMTWRMGGGWVDEISQMTKTYFHVGEKETTLEAKER